MRTKILFDNVLAASPATSEVMDFEGQDARFLIQLVKTGTNGNPRVIVEETIDQTVWTALENTETWEDYFDLSASKMGVKDNYFMGKFLRVRLEPNGTTTGTVWAIIGYKTKP